MRFPLSFERFRKARLTRRLFFVLTAIGTVPKDLYLQRSPYGSNDSVLTFLTSDLLPKTIVDPTRNLSKIVIVNSGSTRFDVFAGSFTSGDNYIVALFLDGSQYCNHALTRP